MACIESVAASKATLRRRVVAKQGPAPPRAYPFGIGTLLRRLTNGNASRSAANAGALAHLTLSWKEVGRSPGAALAIPLLPRLTGPSRASICLETGPLYETLRALSAQPLWWYMRQALRP